MPKKKPNSPAKKMGRPVIEFDWHTLDKFLAYRASLADCAELMNCSEDTITRRIKEEHGVTFAVYRDKKMAKTRVKLVETALHLATKGNVTMLIFSLKNLCGWTDRYEDVSEKTDVKEVVGVTMEAIKKALKKDVFVDVTPKKKQLDPMGGVNENDLGSTDNLDTSPGED